MALAHPGIGQEKEEGRLTKYSGKGSPRSNRRRGIKPTVMLYRVELD